MAPKPINDIELLCGECDRKLFPAKENNKIYTEEEGKEVKIEDIL